MKPVTNRCINYLFLLLLMGCASEPAESEAPPNILFIFTDDQMYRSIHHLNNPVIETPNLDRLAQRGVAFTHAFIQGAFTPAVCVASRAVLNTGRSIHSIRSPQLEGYPLWGETFRAAGYETFMTGKWHNGEAALRRSFAYLGGLGAAFHPSDTMDIKAWNPYLLQGMIHSTDSVYNRPAPDNAWAPDDRSQLGHWIETPGGIAHSSELWTEGAIQFLQRRPGREAQPFFMYVSYHAPHDPRQAPEEYLERYALDEIPIPPNLLPEHPFGMGYDKYRLRDERLAPFPRTEEAIHVQLREYYAIITHLDTQIGRLLDALETSGQAENTIIVFSADNGLAMGEHGLMGKQSLYEHSIRIPMIFAGKGIPRGKTNASPVYLNSLFATTCELAGLAPPDSVAYRSIAPLIFQPEQYRPAPIYGAYYNHRAGEQYCRMIRTEQYKLIVYPMAGEMQLFDLQADPWEMNNLADEESYQPVVEEMTQRLRQAQQIHGDTLSL